MKKILVLFLLFPTGLFAQIIKGTFPQAKKSEIILSGFSGFETLELAKTLTDSIGNFELHYPISYVGAAWLEIKNTTKVMILLNHENFEVEWENIEEFKTLQFKNSLENNTFSEAIFINQQAENKLSGLKFLLPKYDTLSAQQKWLQEEIANQEQQFKNYLNQLPQNSYAKHYLKIRKLITDFPITANRYIERKPEHESAFNALDFNEDKFYTSGLVKEVVEGYFRLMESHLKVKEMYAHINTSTDAIVKSLATNGAFQQEVAQYLFKYFEKRSLFPAAEHLALQMLRQSNCQLSDKSINLFEQYRKLALGKTAPNIVLNQKNLKKTNTNFKLVAFGASWCPNCQNDYAKWKEYYQQLKEKYDLEIFYISIDTDKATFEAYYKEAPFIVFCDEKGWDTQAAKDYFVFATPTYILLDRNLKIVAKINSPEHLDVWLKNKTNQ